MANLVGSQSVADLHIKHSLTDHVIGGVEQTGGKLRQRVRRRHLTIAGKPLASLLDCCPTESDATLGLGLDEV